MNFAFGDRRAAGLVLGRLLGRLRGRPDLIVLGLVRGGVPVAAAVAESLGAPLDALVVRKLGLPEAPEVAFGALGPGGVRIFNRRIAATLPPDEVADRLRLAELELHRREALLRPGRPPPRLTGRIAILVDDGLATGATARAAVEVARRLGATGVLVAAGVGSTEAVTRLARVADRVVCALVPPEFGAVGRYYRDFHQVDTAEVLDLLDPARRAGTGPAPERPRPRPAAPDPP